MTANSSKNAVTSDDVARALACLAETVEAARGRPANATVSCTPRHSTEALATPPKDDHSRSSVNQLAQPSFDRPIESSVSSPSASMSSAATPKACMRTKLLADEFEAAEERTKLLAEEHENLAECLALQQDLRETEASMETAAAEVLTEAAALRGSRERHDRWKHQMQDAVIRLGSDNARLERSLVQAGIEERRLVELMRVEPVRAEKALAPLHAECQRLDMENYQLREDLVGGGLELGAVRNGVARDQRRVSSQSLNSVDVLETRRRAPVAASSGKVASANVNQRPCHAKPFQG